MRNIRVNKGWPCTHNDFTLRDWRSRHPNDKNFGGQGYINHMRGNSYLGNGGQYGHKYFIRDAEQDSFDRLMSCDYEAYALALSSSSPSISCSTIVMAYTIKKDERYIQT